MKIVIAVNGTPESEDAIKKAIDFGFLENAEIHLVTVSPINSDIPSSPYMARETMDELVEANRKVTIDILSRAKALFPKGTNVMQSAGLEGDPAMKIIEYADEVKADFILTGNRSLGGFMKAVLGTVSGKIANNSHTSVIIIK